MQMQGANNCLLAIDFVVELAHVATQRTDGDNARAHQRQRFAFGPMCKGYRKRRGDRQQNHHNYGQWHTCSRFFGCRAVSAA